MNVFSELKRRNVVRVGLAYAVVAWFVVQAADSMLENVGAPAWVFKIFAVLAALGFPLVPFLSWALELTPDGIRRTESEAASAPAAESPPPGKRTALAAALLVLLGIGLGAGWFLRPSAPTEKRDGIESAIAARPTGILDKSIAVMPFSDVSPRRDQQWFADGLAEEILNALARAPDLKVASRMASFGFRDSDQSPRAIGEILKVAHVLEGSVRRAGG